MLEQLFVLLKVLRDGKKSQKEITSIQYESLRSVLVSAYENVKYYRKIMQEADYNPLTDYSGPEDLRKLPILTKQKIKELPVTDFIHKDYQNSYKNEFSKSTSGSTGIPLTIYKSKTEKLLEIAKWFRVFFDNGYCITDKFLSFSHPSEIRKYKSFIQKFGLFRSMTIDFTRPMSEIIDELVSYNPDTMTGNKISFDLLCEELENKNIVLSLKFIRVTGEVISKECIEKYQTVLKTKVIHSYGTIEMGAMAYSKENDPFELVLNNDLTYFEFITDDGKPAKIGERSRIIVTDLSGKLMPFIRYDQGDYVYFDEITKNAETMKIISKIEGRQEDIVKLPNGETIPFLNFYIIMNKYKSIKQFRIIQKKIDTFKVLIVSENDYFEQILSEIEDNLKALAAQKLLFKIKNVSAIPPDPNGKLRILVSEVS